MIFFPSKIYKRSFVFFFFIFFTTISAQFDRHPEHGAVLDKIAQVLQYETKANLDSLNTILKKSNDVCMQTYAVYYDSSIYYLLRNELDMAEKKSLQCIETAGNNKSKMHLSCFETVVQNAAKRLFYIYRRKGDYSKALLILSKNRQNFKPVEYQSLQSINQFDLGNYEKAIAGFHVFLKAMNSERQVLALPVLKSINSVKISNTHSFIADSFLQLFKKNKQTKMLDSAVVHYEKAYLMVKSSSSKANYNASLYHSRLAKIEFYRENYDKAIANYQKYFKHPVMRQNSFTYQSYCIGLAENYLRLNQPDLALKHLKKWDSAYAKKPGSEDYYIAGLSNYMDAYQKIGNSEKALQYAQLYMGEIKNLEANKVKTLEAMNVLNIKESNERAEKIINSKNNWVIFLCFLGLILLIGGFLVFRNFKKQKHQDQSNHQEIIKTMEERFEQQANLSSKEIVADEKTERSKYVTDVKEFEQISIKLQKLEKSKKFLNPDYKLSSLAKKLGTNTAYLSAYFNLHLDKSFNIYLQEKRIEYLLELLEQETVYRKYTVQAIAEHIGYKSPSAFTKIFKKHTGINFSSYLDRFDA